MVYQAKYKYQYGIRGIPTFVKYFFKNLYLLRLFNNTSKIMIMRNILKATLILGTIAALSAGAATLLSEEENQKKLKTATNEFSNKAGKFAKRIEKEYSEASENFNSYTKSREYKDKVQDIAYASKEIIKQLELLKDSSQDLLKAFRNRI